MTITEELCKCGRSKARVHCPECGLTYCVFNAASKTSTVIDSDGTKRELRVFKCRKCGIFFDEDQWKLRCMAPPPSQKHNTVDKVFKEIIKSQKPPTDAQRIYAEQGREAALASLFGVHEASSSKTQRVVAEVMSKDVNGNEVAEAHSDMLSVNPEELFKSDKKEDHNGGK